MAQRTSKKEPKVKVLFYDIETNLVKALIFGLGKQVIRHNQLMPRDQYTRLITIQYCWEHDKKGKVIVVDPYDPAPAIKKFDKIIKEADIIIGKNSTRFDNKHINTQRLLDPESEGMPEWLQKTDDLETQMRKHFNLLSYSLDYFSELLGLGGKIKMEFSDWVDIHCLNELQHIEKLAGKVAAKKIAEFLYGKPYNEVIRVGKKALDKMTKYGSKDAEDTRDLWKYSSKHFERKQTFSRLTGSMTCKECGSNKIRKNGIFITKAGVEYQQYYCNNHRGYAGKLKKNSNKTILQ